MAYALIYVILNQWLVETFFADLYRCWFVFLVAVMMLLLFRLLFIAADGAILYDVCVGLSAFYMLF